MLVEFFLTQVFPMLGRSYEGCHNNYWGSAKFHQKCLDQERVIKNTKQEHYAERNVGY